MTLRGILVCCLFIGANALHHPEGRIVGGTDAKPGEIPYAVSIRFMTRHACGGSILDNKWALSSAQCITGKNINYLTLQYGVTTISKDGPALEISRAFPHSLFGSYSLTYDVSVVKVSDKMIFSELAKPVVLPEFNEPPPAKVWGVLAGWGVDLEAHDPLPNLQRVDLLLYEHKDCKADSSFHFRINERHHLCAGVPGGGKAACTLDDGGPLVANGKLFGVVSRYNLGCQSKQFPDIFAKVATYIDWIDKQREMY